MLHSTDSSLLGLILVLVSTAQILAYSRIGFILVNSKLFSIGGEHVAGNNDKWNLGTGAGLYLNATRDPWKSNYQMYSYITEELPAIVEQNFPILPNKQSIMGHR